MRLRALLVVSLVLPVLGAPAAGEVYVQSTPDRAFVLVMQGAEFNGQAWPRTPLLEAAVGEMVQLVVVVPPHAEPHTFHLHGHPWFLPSKGGMIDTILLRPGDVHTFSVKAGGLAEASGDWMYHCHFDAHVEDGMWGIFRVHPYAVQVAGAAPTFDVALQRLGEPVDGATLGLTLDGRPVPARVQALGEGRYAVHAALDPLARGVLAVTARHAIGESVARVGLGGAEVPAPTASGSHVQGGGHH